MMICNKFSDHIISASRFREDLPEQISCLHDHHQFQTVDSFGGWLQPLLGVDDYTVSWGTAVSDTT